MGAHDRAGGIVAVELVKTVISHLARRGYFTTIVTAKVCAGGTSFSQLVLFLGLFLIVGGAEQAGITHTLLQAAERLNLHNSVIFVSAVALLSNLVSNVPSVMLLKNLVPQLQDPHTMWLMLSMASTLAGNLTITGSVANIIVVEKARAVPHISFFEYMKTGVPITIATARCRIVEAAVGALE